MVVSEFSYIIHSCYIMRCFHCSFVFLFVWFGTANISITYALVPSFFIPPLPLLSMTLIKPRYISNVSVSVNVCFIINWYFMGEKIRDLTVLINWFSWSIDSQRFDDDNEEHGSSIHPEWNVDFLAQELTGLVNKSTNQNGSLVKMDWAWTRPIEGIA